MAIFTHLPERSGIYQIVNNITQKRYIGYASSVRQRLKGHLHDLNNNKHPNDYLQKSWNKYGYNNFSLLIIQECSKEDLCLMEDYWVKILKTTDREFGYNLKETDPLGKASCSEETKLKISNSNKGRKSSLYCIQRRKETKTSPEGRQRQIESLKKVDWFKVRESKRKKVIDTNTGIIYESLKKAAEVFNIPKYNLSKYLLGTRTNKTSLTYYNS